MKTISIIRPGLLSSIQDRGRWGYQKYGMSPAGVMDSFSTRIANKLVDNDEYEALLETTLLGPEILFNCDEVISITGANMNPKINGQPVPMWTSLFVEKGDLLSLSGSVSGLRSYIAFSRGLDVPTIMGSKSTFTRAKLGGFHGRKLNKDDQISLGDRELSTRGAYLPEKYKPRYKEDSKIRVVLGPQDDYFTKEAIETFLSSKYKITSEADRMGYRLDGPKIDHIDGADIVSDGILFGSIQVPGHGSPIIMMADRQTTGGYSKIATVITEDLDKLAQMAPGNTMDFEAIKVEESHVIYKEYEKYLDEISDFINNNRFKFNNLKKLNLSIDNSKFKVEVREIE